MANGAAAPANQRLERADGPPQNEDGRFRRSMRTQRAVLDAFLELINEGDLAPTAQRIADRSGASLRTVFHQFSDLDTIHKLAGQRLLAQIERTGRAVPAQGPLDRRIDLYVANRVTLMKAFHRPASAARLREPFSATLRQNRDFFLALGDQEIRHVFARELGELPDDTRPVLVRSIALVSNWAAWYSLVEEFGLDVQAATDVIRGSLRAVLGLRRAFTARADP